MNSTITPDDIAVHLGRAAPAIGSLTWDQWVAWIVIAERAITRRATKCSVDPNALDQGAVDEVVTYAVVRMARMPADGAVSVSDQVSVDDGSVNQSRQYRHGYGDVLITDEWWEILGLCRRSSAFTIRSRWRPGFAP